AAAAIEAVGAVRFEAGEAGAVRQLEDFQRLAGLRIDAAQVALLALPGAVPQIAVDPCDAGHHPRTVDRAQYRAGVGIDLVDLALSILADPQRAFGPCHARIAAIARRGNRRQHLAGFRIDLLDAALG